MWGRALERKDLQCQGKPENPCIFLKSKKVNHRVVSCPRPKSWHRLVMAAKPCQSGTFYPVNSQQGPARASWTKDAPTSLRDGRRRSQLGGGQVGDVGSHPRRHKEGPCEGHSTVQLLSGTLGAASSSGKGLGCKSWFGSPGCRRSCQR